MTRKTEDPAEIARFWREIGPKGWYEQSDAVDREIRERFAGAWEAARDGAHDDWADAPETGFALIVLLDQFPRNMFRGHSDAFATDPMAREMATKMIEAGHDLKIDEPERQFFYMPFEHSEALADQDRAIELIAERLKEGDGSSLLHARAHRHIIEKFGRFPFRNEALGRETTEEEREWLAAGGYRLACREVGLE